MVDVVVEMGYMVEIRGNVLLFGLLSFLKSYDSHVCETAKTFNNNLNEGACLSDILKLEAMKQYLKEVQCPCAPTYCI